MRIGNWFHLNHQISDLNGEQILKEISLSKMKREVDMLIIDDEEFPLLDDLKKHEFNIEYKNDITALKDAEPYHVILCDIHGVGKLFGSDKEGAYLVHCIKEKYPSKIVISYTADTAPSLDMQKFLRSADRVVPKGTSIEDWASILNNAVKDIVNPVNVWKKMQNEMFQANISTREIAVLESMYVKAIKTGKYESLKELMNENNNKIAEIFNLAIPSLIKLLSYAGSK